ncbi:MAG: peptidoglycan editing factor PgeF [Deltaproteobacteria bacterium]|nr:peptidoglycan editing factor PgeF [Deltaproteobacteria bacterium]
MIQHPFERHETAAAVWLTAPLLTEHGVLHAFSTAQRTIVGQAGRREADLAALAEAIGAGRPAIYRVQQVHGAALVEVSAEDEAQAVAKREADALVASTRGLGLVVQTADCLPILVADQTAGVAAAIHAGWRGCVAGVIQAAIARLRDRGAKPERMLAAIGPAISGRNYQIGPEVAEQFAGFAGALSERAGHSYLDLPKVAGQILLEQGLAATRITACQRCTLEQAELLFSYRRQGKAAGRNLSLVVVP